MIYASIEKYAMMKTEIQKDNYYLDLKINNEPVITYSFDSFVKALAFINKKLERSNESKYVSSIIYFLDNNKKTTIFKQNLRYIKGNIDG